MSFPLNFWQLYLITQKAICWSCQKKSVVRWLAEWAEQNTISGIGFHAAFLFLWTRNEKMLYWFLMSHSGKAVTARGWHLHGKPSYTTPEAQRYWHKYVCHDKCYRSLLCTHGSCTHVTHRAEAQSKRESARAADENAPLAHTKETALIRANKSMSLHQKFTQTLGRSMSSSGKCGRVKNHKYPDVNFTIASCC